MTDAREQAVAAGCRSGDAGAIQEAAALLGHAEAYTRGRASEMLADAPLPSLKPALKRGLFGAHAALWWRVLALRRELGEAQPAGADWERVLGDALRALDREDADAWFQVARWSPAAPDSLRDELTHDLLLHPDDEVAVVTAMLLERALSDDERDRLVRVDGRLRLDALLARLERGDGTAWAPLARLVHHAGPMSFEALAALLHHAPAGANVELLRPQWDRRWFVNVVHARAAWTAAALGDELARQRLDGWRGHRRADVRVVAHAGWISTADPAEQQRLFESAARDASFAALVSALDVRDPASRHAVVELALGHADADVRAAAIDLLGRAGEHDVLRARGPVEQDPVLRARIEEAVSAS